MTDAGTAKSAAKQVIYVDVDDEITAIIDKMNASPARVVALVLPKRAGVFQSVVNMKLLKRRAESAGKNVVLVTSESSLLPLAGLAGVHVAPTPQSKPYIPPSALTGTDFDDDGEETAALGDDSSDFDAGQNAATPVGALAGAASGSVAGATAVNGIVDRDEDEAVELDNAPKSKVAGLFKRGGNDAAGAAAGTAAGASAASATPPAVKKQLDHIKDKNPKVPNFMRFRNRMIIGVLVLILLIAGWIVANNVLPKATVTIRTNSSDIDSKLSLTLDSAAKTVDTTKLVVPAETKQDTKSSTQQVAASGQQNKGEKATGAVRLSLADCSQNAVTIPAGTGLSSGGLTFITQTSATLSSIKIGGSCRNADFPTIATSSVSVLAQKGGANYNLAPASFSGAPSGVTAASSDAMTGGTDNIVKIVQQSDVDAAKQKVASAQKSDAIKDQLQQKLEDDQLFAMPSTFYTSEPNVNISSQVGDEADNVTVTESITYTMFGVRRDDLKKLVEADIDDKIDHSKQSILDDGLSKARITVGSPSAGPTVQADVVLTATAGPKIDAEKLKTDIVGLKSGEVKDKIKSNPGVEDVTVKYGPFWVTKAPKAQKITVVFEKSLQSSSSAGNADDQ